MHILKLLITFYHRLQALAIQLIYQGGFKGRSPLKKQIPPLLSKERGIKGVRFINLIPLVDRD